jgi:hypothetical protein
MCVCVCMCALAWVGGCDYIWVNHLHISASFCGFPSFQQGRQEQYNFKTHETYGTHRHTYQHSSSLSARSMCFPSFYDSSYMLLVHTILLVAFKVVVYSGTFCTCYNFRESSYSLVLHFWDLFVPLSRNVPSVVAERIYFPMSVIRVCDVMYFHCHVDSRNL